MGGTSCDDGSDASFDETFDSHDVGFSLGVFELISKEVGIGKNEMNRMKCEINLKGNGREGPVRVGVHLTGDQEMGMEATGDGGRVWNCRPLRHMLVNYGCLVWCGKKAEKGMGNL